MPETSSFQWQCFKGCLQHFDQDRARSKGHSIRSYLCLRRQMRTARRWDRLIERSGSSDPKLRTASLEVKAPANVLQSRVKVSVPSCKKGATSMTVARTSTLEQTNH